MIKGTDLHWQYQQIKTEIDNAIESVIAGSAFIGSAEVSHFEKEFSEFVGSESAIAVGNGTDALEIIIKSLCLPPDSEILVPINTFIGTAEAVVNAGMKVRFMPVNDDIMNIDLSCVKEAQTPQTRAIIAVHLYGNPCDFSGLKDYCKDNDIIIIEDCAQSHGAMFDGQMTGNLGYAAGFSFYPGKNLGAFGDAGIILTNDTAFAKTTRMMANHGRVEKYDHEFVGRNSRMDSIQAAVLRAKLNKLNEWTAKRQQNADIYYDRLKAIPSLRLPVVTANSTHVYHQFVIRLEKRDELASYLKDQNIATGIHYPHTLPSLKAFGEFQSKWAHHHQYDLGQRLLSLPVGEHLDVGQIEKICHHVKLFLDSAR